MNSRTDAALILWNTDVIQVVSWVLLQRNLNSCGLEPDEGPDRIENLILSCAAGVVVIDLEPPYNRSAAAALRLLLRFPERSFVMTCADSALALKHAPWLATYPVFQKPYDIDEMADTVGAMANRHRAAAALTLSAAPLLG